MTANDELARLNEQLTAAWDAEWAARRNATAIALKILGLEMAKVRPDAVSLVFLESDDPDNRTSRGYVPYENGMGLLDGSWVQFDETDDELLGESASVVAGIDYEMLGQFPVVAVDSPDGGEYVVDLRSAREMVIES